jgi:hypothetical protein
LLDKAGIKKLKQLIPTPINAGNPLMDLQYVSFAVVLFGLVWASRDMLKWLFNRAADFSASKDQRLKNC